MLPTNRIAVPDQDPAEPELLTRLQRHRAGLIGAELRRLSRRVPTLDATQLEIIGRALEQLSELLIIDPLRRAPPETAPLLDRLFDPGQPQITSCASTANR